MDEHLLSLTAEIRSRLGGTVPPGHRQLLGCSDDAWLFRDAEGLHVQPLLADQPDAGPWDLSPLMDHTLLKPEASAAQVESLCREALAYGFASVCVNPIWVPLASSLLARSPVRTCTVVGFPLGASAARAKAFEAGAALEAGAGEVDMVLALGPLKSGDWAAVAADLRAVRAAVPAPAILKVILETCLLTEPEKERACTLALEAGLDFVKTSTGFSTGGATVEDIALMRRAVGTAMGVKASGGIRSYETALAMVRAGATRLGLSSSVSVAQGGGATAAY